VHVPRTLLFLPSRLLHANNWSLSASQPFLPIFSSLFSELLELTACTSYRLIFFKLRRKSFSSFLLHRLGRKVGGVSPACLTLCCPFHQYRGLRHVKDVSHCMKSVWCVRVIICLRASVPPRHHSSTARPACATCLATISLRREVHESALYKLLVSRCPSITD